MSGGGSKQHKLNIQFFVNPRSVTLAIGTKGAVISETEKETGCSIGFEKVDDVVNGVAVRVCRIGGPSSDVIFQAMRRVWEADDQFAEAKIAIPDALVALVIGKSGGMIKEMQDATGAKLSFAKQHEMGNLAGHLRMLTIKFENSSSLLQIIDKVLNLLAEKQDEPPRARRDLRDSRDQLPPQRMAPPPQLSRPSGGLIRERRDERGPAPQVQAMDFTGEVIEAQFFVPAAHVSLAIGKGGSVIKQICSESGNPVMSFAEADEIIQDVALRRCTISGHVRCVVAAASRLSTLDRQSEANIIFLVPDQNVSFIIGSNGAAIRETTRSSGAFLSFAKREEMGPLDGRERSLSVKGSSQSVAAALEKVLVLNHNASQSGAHGGGKRSAPGPAPGTPESGGPQSTHKKTKFDAMPTSLDSDVQIVVPAWLRGYIDDSMCGQIEQAYNVRTILKQNEQNDVVISINGEQSVQAQIELQMSLMGSVGGLQWQLTAIK